MDNDDLTEEATVYTSAMQDTNGLPHNSNGGMIGYDYDTCGSRGGWGSLDNINDGCYSPRIYVDASVPHGALPDAQNIRVEIRVNNNQRNMHFNLDAEDWQLTHDCWSCNDGYHLYGSTCVLNECTCEHGVNATGT